MTWEINRSQSFQKEMLSIGEAPIRFTALELSDAKDPLSCLASLKSALIRKTYYAVGLGFDTVTKISEVTMLEPKKVRILLAKLVSADLITHDKQKDYYYENCQIWNEKHSLKLRSSKTFITDAELEKPFILDLIADHFSSSEEYSEAYVNEYCALFTDNYARLKQKLIDEKKISSQ